MSYPKNQKEDLRQLAAQRRVEKAERIARVLELRDQGLPCTVIALRLKVSHYWVKQTIKANGRRPLSPCEVDTTGDPV